MLDEKIKKEDFLEMVEDLALSMESGLTVFEGLELLEKNKYKPALESSSSSFREHLLKGDSISKAWKKVFPQAGQKAYSLVRIYEKNGAPAQGLRILAEDLRAQIAYKEEMKKTLFYPLLLAFLALITLLWFLNFFLPSLLDLSSSLLTDQELARSEKLFWRLRMAVNLLSLLFLFLASYIILVKEARKKIRDWLAEKKIFSEIFNTFSLVTFSESFSFLLKNGFPLMEALDILGEEGGLDIKEEETRECKRLIREGLPLSRGLEAYSFFSSRDLAIVRKGEKRGSLPQSFKLIHDYSAEKKKRLYKDFFLYFEPLLILTAGLLTGLLVYNFYKLIFTVTLNMV